MKFNFVQKTQWAHMSISPRSGARRLERCIKLGKYIQFGAEHCRDYLTALPFIIKKTFKFKL